MTAEASLSGGALVFDPEVSCWGCGREPQAYLWTPKPPRSMPARLGEKCCASWRAEAEIKAELVPARIQSLPLPSEA